MHADDVRVRAHCQRHGSELVPLIVRAIYESAVVQIEARKNRDEAPFDLIAWRGAVGSEREVLLSEAGAANPTSVIAYTAKDRLVEFEEA